MAKYDKPKTKLSEEDISVLLKVQFASFLASTEKLIEEKIKSFNERNQSPKKYEDQKRGKSLHDFLEFMQYFSSQASAVNRSLSLAGVAIIWIFKKPSENSEIVKGLLNLPLLCLAISLTLDLIQYFFGAIAWNIFYERKYHLWKKRGFPSEYARDIAATNWISVPVSLFFLFKIIFTIIAYWHILHFLSNKL